MESPDRGSRNRIPPQYDLSDLRGRAGPSTICRSYETGISAKPPYHFRQRQIGLSQLHLEAEKKIV